MESRRWISCGLADRLSFGHPTAELCFVGWTVKKRLFWEVFWGVCCKMVPTAKKCFLITPIKFTYGKKTFLPGILICLKGTQGKLFKGFLKKFRIFFCYRILWCIPSWYYLGYGSVFNRNTRAVLTKTFASSSNGMANNISSWIKFNQQFLSYSV